MLLCLPLHQQTFSSTVTVITELTYSLSGVTVKPKTSCPLNKASESQRLLIDDNRKSPACDSDYKCDYLLICSWWK